MSNLRDLAFFIDTFRCVEHLCGLEARLRSIHCHANTGHALVYDKHVCQNALRCSWLHESPYRPITHSAVNSSCLSYYFRESLSGWSVLLSGQCSVALTDFPDQTIKRRCSAMLDTASIWGTFMSCGKSC
jgi:hypothetical protein